MSNTEMVLAVSKQESEVLVVSACLSSRAALTDDSSASPRGIQERTVGRSALSELVRRSGRWRGRDGPKRDAKTLVRWNGCRSAAGCLQLGLVAERDDVFG